MAQFGVYPVKRHGLVIDCQHDFFERLQSRIVAPLRSVGDPAVSSSRLNPEVEIDGKTYRVAVHLLRAVDQHDLGPLVARLDDEDFAIKAALDLLISGF